MFLRSLTAIIFLTVWVSFSEAKAQGSGYDQQGNELGNGDTKAENNEKVLDSTKRIRENLAEMFSTLAASGPPHVAQAAVAVLRNMTNYPLDLLEAIASITDAALEARQKVTSERLAKILKQPQGNTRVEQLINMLPARAFPILKPLETITNFVSMNSGSDGIANPANLLVMAADLKQGKNPMGEGTFANVDNPQPSKKVEHIMNNFFNPFAIFRNLFG